LTNLALTTPTITAAISSSLKALSASTCTCQYCKIAAKAPPFLVFQRLLGVLLNASVEGLLAAFHFIRMHFLSQNRPSFSDLDVGQRELYSSGCITSLIPIIINKLFPPIVREYCLGILSRIAKHPGAKDTVVAKVCLLQFLSIMLLLIVLLK
jgi:hypothetical protein